MAIRHFKEIASQKLLMLSAIFTGFALFYIRDSAWDDVFLPLLGLIGRGMNVAWPSWSTHRLIYDLIPMIIVWTYSALVGWLVARFHPSAPKAMVVTAAAVWLFYVAVLFVGELFDPVSYGRVLIVWAIRETGAITSMLIGGGVLSLSVRGDPLREERSTVS